MTTLLRFLVTLSGLLLLGACAAALVLWLLALPAHAQCPTHPPEAPTPGVIGRVLSNLFLPQEADAICCSKAGVDCATPVPGTTPCAADRTPVAGSSCIGPTIVSVASSDWTSSMIAVWLLDEASGTRDNAQGTATYDLADSGTVTNDTTNKVQGAASALYNANETLSVTQDAVAAPTAPFSAACWSRETGSASSPSPLQSYTGTTGGYQWYYAHSDTAYHPCLRNTSGWTCVASASVSDATWTHVALTVNSANTQGVPYINGTAISTISEATVYGAVSGATYRLGGNLPYDENFVGNIDECAVDNVQWEAAEACKVTRCGVDGKLCECNVDTPANYLACDEDADCRTRADTGQLCDVGNGTCRGRSTSPVTISCTPAACNAGAPS